MSGATTAFFREFHYVFVHMGPPRYLDTPSIASCPECPLSIRFRTAGCSCTGTVSRLSTNKQSSCTAIWFHTGFIWGPISSNPCFSPLSITLLIHQVFSEVSSLRGSCQAVLRDCLMSPLPTVFAVQFPFCKCDEFGVLALLRKRLVLPRCPLLS